jgi:ketosteroid isomerase-like protein
MRAFIVVALVLSACASAPRAEAPTAAPVVAAERAFAADAAQRGWAAAFRSYAAPDAITLSPDPINAHEQLAQFQGDGETNLDWRPAYAGISRGGDFGFTTGPFQFRGREGIVGHYFTVWKRQPDGSWKWIFDAGTDVRDPGPAIATDAVIPTLSVANSGAGSALTASEEVRRLEHHTAIARPEPRSQLLRRLASDVRLNRPGHPAAVGAEAASALAQATALDAVEEPLRIEPAPAGDMVFVLGRTSWLEGETRREGYLARIWQRRGEDWQIVFDEIVPRRGPPPG